MRASTLLLVLLLALLPACMQTKETVKIKKNGKGTIVLHTVVDKEMADGMMEMMKGMGALPPGASDPLSLIDPERARESLAGKEGLEVRSATRTVDEKTGKATMHLEVAFDAIQTLYQSGAVMGVGAKLEKLEDGNYRFTRSLFAEQLPKEGDLESQQIFEGYLMLVQPYLEAMTFEAEFTLPTQIIETSGEKVDDKTVRWVVGYNDLVKPSARTQTVVFSGEGLDWEPFESKAANPFESRKRDVPTGPITPSEDGGDEKPADDPEAEPEQKPEGDTDK